MLLYAYLGFHHYCQLDHLAPSCLFRLGAGMVCVLQYAYVSFHYCCQLDHLAAMCLFKLSLLLLIGPSCCHVPIKAFTTAVNWTILLPHAYLGFHYCWTTFLLYDYLGFRHCCQLNHLHSAVVRTPPGVWDARDSFPSRVMKASLETDILVVTLPGTWLSEVSARTRCSSAGALSLEIVARSRVSSSSRSSDGNSSLLDEGGSASQVLQATVELP